LRTCWCLRDKLARKPHFQWSNQRLGRSTLCSRALAGIVPGKSTRCCRRAGEVLGLRCKHSLRPRLRENKTPLRGLARERSRELARSPPQPTSETAVQLDASASFLPCCETRNNGKLC